jgi:hypothetical protein
MEERFPVGQEAERRPAVEFAVGRIDAVRRGGAEAVAAGDEVGEVEAETLRSESVDEARRITRDGRPTAATRVDAHRVVGPQAAHGVHTIDARGRFDRALEHVQVGDAANILRQAEGGAQVDQAQALGLDDETLGTRRHITGQAAEHQANAVGPGDVDLGRPLQHQRRTRRQFQFGEAGVQIDPFAGDASVAVHRHAAMRPLRMGRATQDRALHSAGRRRTGDHRGRGIGDRRLTAPEERQHRDQHQRRRCERHHADHAAAAFTLSDLTQHACRHGRAGTFLRQRAHHLFAVDGPGTELGERAVDHQVQTHLLTGAGVTLDQRGEFAAGVLVTGEVVGDQPIDFLLLTRHNGLRV